MIVDNDHEMNNDVECNHKIRWLQNANLKRETGTNDQGIIISIMTL